MLGYACLADSEGAFRKDLTGLSEFNGFRVRVIHRSSDLLRWRRFKPLLTLVDNLQRKFASLSWVVDIG